MQSHADFPQLHGLPELIHKQRRLLAGQLRITTEDRALRETIATLMLSATPAAAITCKCIVGGVEREFELRRYQSGRDGKTRVKVIPIR